MGLFGFIDRKEQILGLDIGSTGIKLVELDLSASRPRLVSLAHLPLGLDNFNNYLLSRPDGVAEQISKLLESNEIKTKLVALAVPGPSVFTKKIKMPKIDREELSVNIHMEAANFIPHNIDAIKLDYHVLGESGKNQLDVLVVAVKTEIIESFIEASLGAGLEAGVVDVDTFAIQNTFELGYAQEFAGKTVALVHVGSRYAAVNICKNGTCLFSGDVAVGGKSMTEGIATELATSMREAEEHKRKGGSTDQAKAAIKKQIEQVTSELNRQLAFFWNASGAEDGIDQIMVSGGGAALPGFVETLGAKTGIACAVLDPFKGIATEGDVDPVLVKELSPLVAVAVGLALRQPGDKIFPDGM